MSRENKFKNQDSTEEKKKRESEGGWAKKNEAKVIEVLVHILPGDSSSFFSRRVGKRFPWAQFDVVIPVQTKGEEEQEEEGKKTYGPFYTDAITAFPDVHASL